MKILKASEIARAKHPNLPEHILASEERSGLWVSRQDIRVAERQAELTNKDWVEWLNGHSSHSGRYRDYLDVTHIGRVVYEEALQARLKEIE